MASYVTEESIKEDRWNAVELDLPPNASPGLLASAEKAARECHYEAWGDVRRVDHEDENTWADAEYARFRADQAEERYRKIEKLRAGQEQKQEQKLQR